MPLYTVSDSSDGTVRLVDAHSRAAALKHVCEERFVVAVPDSLEAAKLAAEGVAIEKAVPPTKREPATGPRQTSLPVEGSPA